MSNREKAIEFIRLFCRGDVSGLEPYLAPNLKFNGPFYHFTSRSDYLEVLRDDPPERCAFQQLSVTEGEHEVAVFYDYQKSDRAITIAQLFRFRNGAISEIRLVFDGREIESC